MVNRKHIRPGAERCRRGKPGEPLIAAKGGADDLVTLCRSILHMAQRPTSRSEFLRELSTGVLQFADCDALHMRLVGIGGWSCTARIWPREEFVFESGDVDRPQGDGLSLEALVTEYVRNVLGCAPDQLADHFTAYGSFWMEHSDAEDRCAEGLKSLAVIPFEVSAGYAGLLRLDSRKAGVFAPDTIDFFEALAQIVGMGLADRRAHAALRERVKELTCLYNISRITSQTEVPVAEQLRRIAELLPAAWQYPELAVAGIVLGKDTYATGDLVSASVRQCQDIVLDGVKQGRVEIGYVADRPEFAQGAFLEEEADLLAAAAREIAEIIGRHRDAQHGKELEEQIRRAGRLATIGQLVTGVAHEINEPLNAILGCAQLARKAPQLDGDVAGDLDDIIAAALHARDIVNKLMLFARQRPPRKVLLNLNDVVEQSLSILKTRCEKGGIELGQTLSDELPLIFADSSQLQQVVVNLVVNAVQAMPGGGRLSIVTHGDADSATLVVQDTGVGMSQEVLAQCFEPFYTTKDVGEGTGLGLAIVHGIVTAHHGTIGCASQPGAGTRFEIRLPAASQIEDQEEDAR